MAELENQGKLGKHPRPKKKGKAYYSSGKRPKRSNGGRPMELSCGMQGVLITTGDQEKLCVPEAYNLLNRYADRLYGAEFSPQDSDGTSDDDVSAALAKEVSSLKGSEQRERRFKSVNSGAKHVVFIACAPPVDPCELVHTILTDVAASGERVSRYCQRVLPVVSVFHTNMAELFKHAVTVLEPHFHTDHTLIVKYAVSYKARNNNVMKREEVIKLVASAVTRNGDYDHQVDLSNPDLTVIVEIIKNLCCMSVVRDYHKLSKYNIHMLTEPSKENTAAKTVITSPAQSSDVTVVDTGAGPAHSDKVENFSTTTQQVSGHEDSSTEQNSVSDSHKQHTCT